MIHPVAKQVLDPCRPDKGAGRGDLCTAHRDFREVLCRPYVSLASLASRLHENSLKYKGEIEFLKLIQRSFLASLMCHLCVTRRGLSKLDQWMPRSSRRMKDRAQQC